MNKDNRVPFYSNTKDDTHCFQACLRMLLGFYFPDEEYSWQELDRVTDKKEGKWTWPMAGMIFLQSKGIAPTIIEKFDYQAFHNKGVDYIYEKYGEEVARSAIENSDIEQAYAVMPEFVKKINIENRVPQREEMLSLLRQGFLLICQINIKVLNNQEGFVGHFVLVKGFDLEENFIVHDPGLPARENRLVNFELFERAWTNPDPESKMLLSFQLKI